MQCSAVQYSAVQDSAAQCSAVYQSEYECSAVSGSLLCLTPAAMPLSTAIVTIWCLVRKNIPEYPWSIVHCTALCCTVLHYTIQFCSFLHYIELAFTALCCTGDPLCSAPGIQIGNWNVPVVHCTSWQLNNFTAAIVNYCTTEVCFCTTLYVVTVV